MTSKVFFRININKLGSGDNSTISIFRSCRDSNTGAVLTVEGNLYVFKLLDGTLMKTVTLLGVSKELIFSKSGQNICVIS